MPSTASRSGLANVERFREHLRTRPTREHSYVILLGLATYDATKLHDKVEEGFSYEALERLRRVLGVSTQQFGALVRIPTRTLARRRDAKRLQADESDRLLRLSRVVGLALQLFEGELDDTRAWLLTPHPGLGNHIPLELATTEVGAREVEHIIGRIEHGIPL